MPCIKALAITAIKNGLGCLGSERKKYFSQNIAEQ